MRRRLAQDPESSEINVSPLIDLVFILLIFFIVATSFVNEVGITPKHKDTASSSANLEEPLAFDLPASGQLLQDGSVIGLEQIAPLVRSRSTEKKPSVLVRVSPWCPGWISYPGNGSGHAGWCRGRKAQSSY